MVSFNYVIKDEIGMHARPEGMLAKEEKAFESKMKLAAKGKEADVTRLMAVMGMGIKCGDEVTVSAEGADEEKAIEALKQFFEANL